VRNFSAHEKYCLFVKILHPGAILNSKSISKVNGVVCPSVYLCLSQRNHRMQGYFFNSPIQHVKRYGNGITETSQW